MSAFYTYMKFFSRVMILRTGFFLIDPFLFLFSFMSRSGRFPVLSRRIGNFLWVLRLPTNEFYDYSSLKEYV